MEDIKTGIYTVAGITFSLEMPIDCPLWNYTEKYRPFLSREGNAPYFRVRLVDQVFWDSMEKVYEEKDPRMPRLEAYVREQQAFFRLAPVCGMPVECEAMVDVPNKCVDFSLLQSRCASGFCLDNVLMVSYALLGADRGVLLMHASCVVEKDQGFIFLGYSGTGKSTHSRLWMEHLDGIWLLNDDNPVVRVEEDGIFVYGSPWSGKTPCYKNKRAHLGGVVSLEQAPENKIRRLPLPQAYADIFSSSSALRINEAMSESLHQTIAAVATGVKAFHLWCLPDGQAARLSHQSLTQP